MSLQLEYLYLQHNFKIQIIVSHLGLLAKKIYQHFEAIAAVNHYSLLKLDPNEHSKFIFKRISSEVLDVWPRLHAKS